MSQPLLQIEDLTLTISGKKILKGLSLDVNRGEYISIVGPNGAGKTSFVKCMSRVHTHWSGTILLEGKNVQHISQRDLARKLSYVPQAEGRPLPFTAYEFVLMGRYPHLSPFSSIQPEDKKMVEETMDMTGIMEFRDRTLNTLSGGERQMVFIAAALAQGADILLLDEPASFLDYRHQAAVMKLLGHLHREQNITILSVSHDINTAYAHSSRIYAIKEGQRAFFGTPEQLMTVENLTELYDTPFSVAPHPTRDGLFAAMEEPA